MKKEKKKTAEEKLVRCLIKKKRIIATVESCTGGAVAASIVNVPGASSVLSESYITYSDKAKHRLIGVRKSTLENEGAVSAKCAKEMAKYGARRAEADLCVSVTGLAGPDGGTEETPVGTVFIGCFFEGRTVVKEYHFEGDRQEVRSQAVKKALKLARKTIRHGEK